MGNGKVKGKGKAKAIAHDSAKAAVGSFIARDPYAQRLLLLKQSSPAMNELIEEWEEAPDPEHPRWLGRFANAGEEAGIGAAASVVLRVLGKGIQRVIVSRRGGNAEEAPEVAGSAEGQAAKDAAQRTAVEGEIRVEQEIAQGIPGAKKDLSGADFGGAAGPTTRALEAGAEAGMGPPKPITVDRERVISELRTSEGFRAEAYKDAKGWAIGYGSTRWSKDGRPVQAGDKISQEQALEELGADLDEAAKQAQAKFPWLGNHPPEVQEAVVRMSFQMGAAGVAKFKDMLAAIRRKDYKAAAEHGLDSEWARTQSPGRAARVMGQVAAAGDETAEDAWKEIGEDPGALTDELNLLEVGSDEAAAVLERPEVSGLVRQLKDETGTPKLDEQIAKSLEGVVDIGTEEGAAMLKAVQRHVQRGPATTTGQVVRALETPASRKDLIRSVAGASVMEVSPATATRNTAIRLHELAQQHELGDVGAVELQRVHQRLLEWRALTKADGVSPRNDQLRGGAAMAALDDYAVAVRQGLKTKLKGEDPEDMPLGVLQDAVNLWEATVGRNPLYEPHMPSMVRPKFASRRMRPASEVRGESTLGQSVNARGEIVPHKGLSKLDGQIFRENIAMQDGIILNREYRPGSGWNEGYQDQPIDVYFADIKGVNDFESLTTAVRDVSGIDRMGTEADAAASLDGLLRHAVHGRPQGFIDQILNKRLRSETYEGQQADILDTAVAMASTVRDLAKIASGAASTPEQRLQFIRAAQKLDAYMHWARGDMDLAQEAFKGATDTTLESLDEVARRMRRSDVLKEEDDTYSRAMAGAIAWRDDVHGVVDLVTAWRADQRKLGEIIRRAGSRYIAKPVRELWINSILSSPATHMRNIIGNSILPMLQIPEHFIAGTMEGGLKQGYREAMYASQALFGGFGKAIRVAAADYRLQMAEMGFREGTDAGALASQKALADAEQAIRDLALRDMPEGLSMVERQAMADDALAMHKEFIQKIKVDDLTNAKALGLPQHMINKMGTNGGWMETLGHSMDVGIRRTLNQPTVMLRAEDVFYKSLTYNMEVSRLAARRAHQEGLNGQAFHDRVAEITRRPNEHLVDIDGRQIDIRAMSMNQAHINTYTNDLQGFAKETLDFLNRMPGARYIVPFFRTPWNITTRAVEHVPGIGMWIGHQRKLMAQGGRERKEVIARQMVGGMMTVAITPLVLNGRMTGGNVHNPQFSWDMAKLGRGQYSVKIGDSWVDYRRAGGAPGVAIGMMVDAATAVHVAATDEEYRDAVALWHTASGMAASILGDTWAGDVNDFMQIVASGDEQGFARWLSRTAVGFTPYSGLSDDVREAISLAIGEGRFTAHAPGGGMAGKDETTWEMVGEAWTETWRRALGPFSLVGEGSRPKIGPGGQPIKPFDEGMFSGPLGAATAFSGIIWLQERKEKHWQEVLRMQVNGLLDPPNTFSVSGARGQTRRMEYTGEQKEFLDRRFHRALEVNLHNAVRTVAYDNGNDTYKKARMWEAYDDALEDAVNATRAKFPDIRRRRMEAQSQMREDYRGY